MRVAKGKWEYLHVNIWKKKHGEVPKGFRVMFKDRNPMNVKLSNLVLRSVADAGKEMIYYDETVAMKLAALRGGKGSYDKELQKKLLKFPELIEAKRVQMKLQKKLAVNARP